MLWYDIIYSKFNPYAYLGLRLQTFSVSFLQSRETISYMPSNPPPPHKEKFAEIATC
jgi:hypothetical protein